MSSSDSSDDENSQLLREAVDTQFINDNMFKSTNTKSKITEDKNSQNVNANDIKSLPSLRPNKNEDDQFNTLDVTPHFRNYVAKQLTKILDEKLNKSLDYDVKENTNDRKRKRKGGIKLFKDSKKFIKVKKSSVVSSFKTEVVSKSSDSDNETKCSEVAVNPEDILSKKDVKNWSTRSKAPIFRYKKSKNDILTSIE